MNDLCFDVLLPEFGKAVVLLLLLQVLMSELSSILMLLQFTEILDME